MYIPRAYKEDRIPVLHKFMDDQPFASLITMGTSGLFASHIPMVLEQNGSMGRLKGHISRANTQWRDYTPSVEALAIFAGPHHYITPSWYPEKQETGKVVPTWNYAVVHAYGHLKVIEDTRVVDGPPQGSDRVFTRQIRPSRGRSGTLRRITSHRW